MSYVAKIRVETKMVLAKKAAISAKTPYVAVGKSGRSSKILGFDRQKPVKRWLLKKVLKMAQKS